MGRAVALCPCMPCVVSGVGTVLVCRLQLSAYLVAGGHTFWLCFCFQVNADKASASAALLDAETELERIHRDVVEVQTKKTLVANSTLVSAASAVLEEQLASARGQQQVLQVRQRGLK